MQTLNAIRVAQRLLLPRVSEARYLVDATAGNGKDTLFLAQNSPKDAIIYAFDIQKNAIEKTRQRLLEQHVADKVELILDSHANAENYINNPIDVAMFNLGYLPGDCHETMTLVNSTVEALTALIDKLSIGGIISIVAYPGHENGKEENHAVYGYIMALPAEQFTVVRVDMINHSNNPPILYLVEKIRVKRRDIKL